MIYIVTVTVQVESESAEQALDKSGLDIKGKDLLAFSVEVGESEE